MKINGKELTDLELALLKVIAKCTAGDTTVQLGDADSEGVYGWFGFFDQDFKDEAAIVGISGRQISGLASSLTKKGIIDVYVEEHYFTGREDRYGMPVYVKMNAFNVQDETLELLKGKKKKKIKINPKKSLGFTEYKLRAEYFSDLQQLQEALIRHSYPHELSMTILFNAVHENLRLPDCEFEFTTHLTLEKIRELISSIVDSHVMLESLNLKLNYTGDRYFTEEK